MISGSRTRAWTAHACAGATDSLRNAYGSTHTIPASAARFLCRARPRPLRYNVYSFRNVIPRYFACSARFRLFVLQAGKTSSAIARGRIVVAASIPSGAPSPVFDLAPRQLTRGVISLAPRISHAIPHVIRSDRSIRPASTSCHDIQIAESLLCEYATFKRFRAEADLQSLI